MTALTERRQARLDRLQQLQNREREILGKQAQLDVMLAEVRTEIQWTQGAIAELNGLIRSDGGAGCREGA